MNHPKYRPDIDGLRAVAILAVVGFHAFPAALPGGFIGVDIFFVISGYLISTIIFSNLANDKFSFREFYARRVKRIFPALLTVLATFFLIGWHTLFADEFQQFGKHLLAGALFVSNFALLQEANYFDAAAETKPLLHLWSLAIEEQFYIIWPLLAVALWRLPRLLPWVMGVLLLASLAYNIAIVDSEPSRAFYLPFSRFWELLAGGMLALQHHRRQRSGTLPPARPQWFVSAGATLGLLLLVAPMFLLSSKMAFPGWLALLPVSGSWLLIQAGPAALPNRWLLASRPMIWIGLVSYPLYLWHWPLLSFALIHGVGEEALGARLLLVALSFVLAWLTFRWVEKPLRFSAQPRLASRGLAVLMLAIGITGFATFDQGGFRQRPVNTHELQTHYDGANWRLKECFIETREGPSGFASHCDSLHGGRSERPLVLLWGDSHAATLLPGLRHQAERLGFDIAQFNANGCPPVPDFVAHRKEPLCPAINAHVLEKIATLKPDLIILGAYWINYSGRGDWNTLEMAQLQTALSRLTAGSAPVVVMGQLPVTDIAQPHIAARLFKPFEVTRTTHHFTSPQFQQRPQLEQTVRAAGATFIAPADILCNDAGCLLSTSEERLQPVAWDYGHLTRDGALLLIEQAVRRGVLVLPEQRNATAD